MNISKIFRTALVFILTFVQISSQAFAVDPTGSGGNSQQPTCTLGNCGSSTGQNNQPQSGNDFFSPSALSRSSIPSGASTFTNPKLKPTETSMISSGLDLVRNPSYANQWWPTQDGTVERGNGNLNIHFKKTGVAESAGVILQPGIDPRIYKELEIKFTSDAAGELNFVLTATGNTGPPFPVASKIIQAGKGVQTVKLYVPDGVTQKLTGFSISEKSTNPVMNLTIHHAVFVSPALQGWTPAASNPNFAFQERLDSQSPGNTYVYLKDLKDSSKEHLIGGGSVTRHAPVKYDVSPDGSTVVVAYRDTGGVVGQLSQIVLYSTADLKAGRQNSVYNITPANAIGIVFSSGIISVEADVRGSAYAQNNETVRNVFNITIPQYRLISQVEYRGGVVTQSTSYDAYHANNAPARIVVRRYTSGKESSATVIEQDLNRVLTHKVEYSYHGNGAVKTLIDIQLASGRNAVVISQQLDAYGRFISYIKDIYDASGTMVVNRVSLSYINGVLTNYSEEQYANQKLVSLRQIEYNLSGQAVRSMDYTFYPGGAVKTRSLVDYADSVATAVTLVTLDERGVLLQYVRNTLYLNGKLQTGLIINYSNGVAVSQGYYIYFPDGRLHQYHVWTPWSGWCLMYYQH